MLLFTRTSSTSYQILMSKFLGFDIKILRKWRSNFSCLIRTPFARNIWMTNCALGGWGRLWHHYRNYPKLSFKVSANLVHRVLLSLQSERGTCRREPLERVFLSDITPLKVNKTTTTKTKIKCARSHSQTIFRVKRWSFALGKAWSEVIRPMGCGWHATYEQRFLVITRYNE